MKKQSSSSTAAVLRLVCCAHHSQRIQRGFTLFELLMIVSIAAVLSALAAPSLQLVVHSNRLVSASNNFFSTLFMARSEAIKRNSRVVICPSGDGQACAMSGGWEQGWLVFHDMNNNAQRNTNESLIQWSLPLHDSLVLTGNTTVSKYISFDGTGAARQLSGAFQAGTLTLCRISNSSTQARKITINAVGRPRVRTFTTSSCA